jgi:hypothetical protein
VAGSPSFISWIRDETRPRDVPHPRDPETTDLRDPETTEPLNSEASDPLEPRH